MFKNELSQIGLSKEEATVYEALLSGKAMPVSEIIKKTPLKKGNVYNILIFVKRLEFLLVISKTQL